MIEIGTIVLGSFLLVFGLVLPLAFWFADDGKTTLLEVYRQASVYLRRMAGRLW